MSILHLLLTRLSSYLHPTDDRYLHLMAKVLINQQQSINNFHTLHQAEFKVYSQFGDDGIIQYLIRNISLLPSEKRFIEIGVEDYQEANTRFLLMNNNWSGLIIDGSPKNMNKVKRQPYYWQYDITATPLFVTRKNILKHLRKDGFNSQLGLLSLDIDGNDYWIMEKLIVLKPIIFIIEYNSLFGIDHPITIPYKKDFYRTKAHYSNLFWGSSLKAIYLLAKRHGYSFMGTNSAGNNAYFVRTDRLNRLKPKTLKEGFTVSKYRESRDQSDKLSYLSRAEAINLIGYQLVQNTKTNRKTKINDL